MISPWCSAPGRRRRRHTPGQAYLPGTAGFGLSDSGGVQAALYANRKYVGIDIERLDRPDLAARRHRLAGWRRDHVPVEFLAGWVAREACAKCVGLGLLHALPRMAIAWTRQVAEGAGPWTSGWTSPAGASWRAAPGWTA